MRIDPIYNTTNLDLYSALSHIQQSNSRHFLQWKAFPFRFPKQILIKQSQQQQKLTWTCELIQEKMCPSYSQLGEADFKSITYSIILSADNTRIQGLGEKDSFI